MKSILLFIALVTALLAQPVTIDSSKITWAEGNALTLISAAPQNLVLSAGGSSITINLKTGQVDLPKDMTLPDAAVAFWLRVAQAFPECRRAMLTGDPTPFEAAHGYDTYTPKTPPDEGSSA